VHSLFWLRQLRRVRRSLDDESMMSPRFCHEPSGSCNMVFAGVPRSVTRQTAASHECCSAPCQWNTQVRPWTVTASTCRLALARCGRSGLVQTRDGSSPVSEQQGAALPGRQLHLGLQSCWSSAVAISPTSPSLRTTAPQHHTWPSVLHCRQSHVWNLLPDNIRNAGGTEATFKQMLKTFFLKQH